MRNLSCIIFYMKMNILQNLHICISVPLNKKIYKYIYKTSELSLL